MSRYLVTGASGFIGSNLALELQKQGSVTGICSLSPGSKENLAQFKGDFLEGDIRSFDFFSLGKFDAIFHEAAITDTTVLDQNLMFSTNVEAFSKILDFAHRSGCKKVVYASSAATYGKGKVPMSEFDSLQPANIYGESKLKMEEVAQIFSREHSEMSIVGLRYFNVYGPHEFHKKSAASMVYQLYLQIFSGKSPRIFKWGDQARDFIYVKDVVLANLKSLEFSGSGIFNVGTGVPTSFNQVIQILNSVLGSDRPIDYFDNPYSFYQENTQAETSLAKKVLGFSCQFSPKEGISDYCNFLKEIKIPAST